jgi:peroxiredoxin
MNFGFYSSYIALWIWAIFQGLLTLAIFRQVQELEKRSGNWETKAGGETLVGARAPKFSGADFHSGQSIDLNHFNGQGGVILFLSAHCSMCRRLSKNLHAVPVESLPPIVAICTGDTKEAAKIAKRLGPQIPLVVEGATHAASVYRVSGYPTAVVLDRERRVRAHSGINSTEDLQKLVAAGETENGKLAMATTHSGENV